jgi:tetratricopeptide (TPR) repeat protein
VFRLVAVLALGAASVASAQLAITQPTEKILLLPLPGMAAGDSAASIAVMDLARDRVQQLARYKVQNIPKSKICEAYLSFGFACDPAPSGAMYIVDQAQAGQFAKSVGVNSYDVGSFAHTGSLYTAHVRLISGGSGFASAFTVSGASPPAVAESLGQRLVTVIKAAEFARECDDRRGHGNLPGALESAKKAFAIDPNLAAAHLCVLTIYEAQRLPPDSIIAAGLAALKGDPNNTTAYSRICGAMQQKADSLKWLDCLQSWAGVEPDNIPLQLSVADQLMKSHAYPKATVLLKTVVAHAPANAQAKDMLRRSCIEGSQWRCVLDIGVAEEKDSAAKLNDSTELKIMVGAASALPDTQAWLHFTGIAVKNFPRNGGFWNIRGQALEASGQIDSALAAYKAGAGLAPNDPRPSLLVAATILNHTVYDTLHQPRGDTVALRAYQNAFADKVDAAKPFIMPALTGADTALKINAAALLLTGGSAIARATAYARAYPWLDQLLTVIQPATPADTLGPKQQIRVQGSFWFGLSSTLGIMGELYHKTVTDKSCDDGKEMSDRINRTREALFLGGRVAPTVATQMLGILGQYSKALGSVKTAFKCSNF